jgi:hypothetical protein
MVLTTQCTITQPLTRTVQNPLSMLRVCYSTNRVAPFGKKCPLSLIEISTVYADLICLSCILRPFCEIALEVLQPYHLNRRDASNQPVALKKRINRSHPKNFFTHDPDFFHLITVPIFILVPHQQSTSTWRTKLACELNSRLVLWNCVYRTLHRYTRNRPSVAGSFLL